MADNFHSHAEVAARWSPYVLEVTSTYFERRSDALTRRPHCSVPSRPNAAESLFAEVGRAPADDQLFHILYDGTVVDERRYSVLGGDAEAIGGRMKETFADGQALPAAVQEATRALSGTERTLLATDLEVAVLSRSGGRRCFRRLSDETVAAALAG